MLEIALDADPEWESSTADWAAMADRAVRAAVGASRYPALADGDVELSMTLTDDETVRGLNAQWRGKDKPTNVLSFPMSEIEDLERAGPGGPPILLGDVVMAHGVCTREAADKGIAMADHAQHLMVHGTLHLLGYDHVADEEAEAMEALETSVLSQLGIADPYRAEAR